jgi:hypothetical protein
MSKKIDHCKIFMSHPLLSLSRIHVTFLWGKGRPARKADNLTAICEPIV